MAIRCSTCGKGKMVSSHVKDYDVSALMGLKPVVLVHAPALVCDKCNAVMLDGEVIEGATDALARLIVRTADELRPAEVRFLREVLGMKQAELAERLGVNRVTIARWETEDGALGGMTSLALRTLVAWHLDDAKLARDVGAPSRRPGHAKVKRPYRLDAVA